MIYVEEIEKVKNPDEPIPEERIYKRIIVTQEGRNKELNKEVLYFCYYYN
jgi:hypothetical protein